jgi:hypothetical protein
MNGGSGFADPPYSSQWRGTKGQNVARASAERRNIAAIDGAQFHTDAAAQYLRPGPVFQNGTFSISMADCGRTEKVAANSPRAEFPLSQPSAPLFDLTKPADRNQRVFLFLLRGTASC